MKLSSAKFERFKPLRIGLGDLLERKINFRGALKAIIVSSIDPDDSKFSGLCIHCDGTIRIMEFFQGYFLEISWSQTQLKPVDCSQL